MKENAHYPERTSVQWGPCTIQKSGQYKKQGSQSSLAQCSIYAQKIKVIYALIAI